MCIDTQPTIDRSWRWALVNAYLTRQLRFATLTVASIRWLRMTVFNRSHDTSRLNPATNEGWIAQCDSAFVTNEYGQIIIYPTYGDAILAAQALYDARYTTKEVSLD